MAHDPTAIVPVAPILIEDQVAPILEVAPGEVPAQPSAEQVRVIDNLMAKEQESKEVAGLFGMVTGAMVLRDLALENFHLRDEDNKRKHDQKEEDEEL
jgi:hypothetical protein